MIKYIYSLIITLVLMVFIIMIIVILALLNPINTRLENKEVITEKVNIQTDKEQYKIDKKKDKGVIYLSEGLYTIKAKQMVTVDYMEYFNTDGMSTQDLIDNQDAYVQTLLPGEVYYNIPIKGSVLVDSTSNKSSVEYVKQNQYYDKSELQDGSRGFFKINKGESFTTAYYFDMFSLTENNKVKATKKVGVSNVDDINGIKYEKKEKKYYNEGNDVVVFL